MRFTIFFAVAATAVIFVGAGTAGAQEGPRCAACLGECEHQHGEGDELTYCMEDCYQVVCAEEESGDPDEMIDSEEGGMGAGWAP